MSDATMRQGIAVRMTDGIAQICAASEIPFAGRIAPGSIGIPVPRLHMQFRVLTVGDRLPAGGQDLRTCRIEVELICCAVGETVDAGAERLGGNNYVSEMIRSGVDANGLGGERGGYRNQRKSSEGDPRRSSGRIFLAGHM